MVNEQHIMNPKIKNQNEHLTNELKNDYGYYTTITEIKKKKLTFLVE